MNDQEWWLVAVYIPIAGASRGGHNTIDVVWNNVLAKLGPVLHFKEIPVSNGAVKNEENFQVREILEFFMR